jgi:ABC-type proline/glycine betaine transport system ATPase subunit
VGVLWYRGGEATVQIETSMSMRRVLVEKGMVVAHDSREAVRLVKRGLDYVFSFGRGPVEEYTLPASLLKKP